MIKPEVQTKAYYNSRNIIKWYQINYERPENQKEEVTSNNATPSNSSDLDFSISGINAMLLMPYSDPESESLRLSMYGNGISFSGTNLDVASIPSSNASSVPDSTPSTGDPSLDDEVARIMAAFSGAKQNSVDAVLNGNY